MKFKVPELGDFRDWHRWFAWHPVKVSDHDVRWLEVVERKGTYQWWGDSYWNWEYRAIK